VNIIRHIYWAVRHGEWSGGCKFYKNKPMIGVFYTYYDGNLFAAHLGPFWIECIY
jgi:hypothetical protein